MTRYFAATFLVACLAFAGCSSSTETKIEYDTTYVHVHDSVKVALVRFVSLMPDNSAINIKLSNSVDAPIYVTTPTQALYLPFVPDSAYQVFLFNGSQFLDQISISDKALRKGSVNTFGLFWFEPDPNSPDGHIQFAGGDNNDSLKLRRVPPGYAMVRLINGNGYIPSSLTVDLDTEVASHPIATATFAQQLTDYVPIPAGAHKLLLSNHVNQTEFGLAPKSANFEAGMFYTVRFIGDSQHAAQLIIDPE